MYVENEISNAIYCLRREYGPDCDEALIEQVVASIRRKHREAMMQAITGRLTKVGNAFRRLLGQPTEPALG